MLRRLYVHNFKCLVNFELNLAGRDSTLLVGRNGTGKSSIRDALRILQRVARGTNRVGDLFQEELVSRISGTEAPHSPVRFELEVEVGKHLFSYQLALERPDGFREYRVQSEVLACDQQELFSRNEARVSLQGKQSPATFQVDWHLIALPIIQEKSDRDPLFLFKRWLARMIILTPHPSGMTSESNSETLLPEPDAGNFAAWFSGLMAESPSAWSDVERHLKDLLPDLVDIKNPLIGRTTRSLEVHFQRDERLLKLPFHALSDGEKCYFLAAVALAAKKSYGPLLCFWDEADSHLSLSEVGQFLLSLRRAFQAGSQLIIASQNPEALRHFSADNTLVLQRRSHLEPTQIRGLSHVQFSGDLVDALIENRLAL